MYVEDSPHFLIRKIEAWKKKKEIGGNGRGMFFGCYSTPDATGHATVAAKVVSIEFRAQLLLVDSPLPTFFCFISCPVFVSDSS